MPKKKLSRKAKKSRVPVYKAEKSVAENFPKTSSPLHSSLPSDSAPGVSPVTVTSTASDTSISSPCLVSTATSSPSLHDLTVTYDYSTDNVALGSHLTTTERFLALFPFTRVSPPGHQGVKSRNTRLWMDLTPPTVRRAKPRPPHRHNTSSDFHQLSLIAQQIRETLAEHKATTVNGINFEPSPDCTNLELSVEDNDHLEENGLCEVNDSDSDEGNKECEEDWFWTQVALQVDDTTPPGKENTPTRKYSRTTRRCNVAKKMLDCSKSLNEPISSHVPTGPPPSHQHRPRPHTAHTPPPSNQEQDDWGTWGDNDFIDQLLTQGVGIDPSQSNRRLEVASQSSRRLEAAPQSSGRLEAAPQSSRRLEVAPQSSRRLEVAPQSSRRLEVAPQSSGRLEAAPQSSRRLEVVPQSSRRLEAAPQSSGGQRMGVVCSKGPRKLSQEEIQAKRDIARRKLSAKLNKQ